MVRSMTQTAPPPASGATTKTGAVLFVDLVESVRLHREYGEEVVRRWLSFEKALRGRIVPVHGGQLVRSSGDGFLLAFGSVDHAVAAAFSMRMTLARDTIAPEARFHLRFGINWCDYIDGGFDIFGEGVDLAARVATIALPDEVMISDAARARLAPTAPVEIEALGPRKLRHVEGMIDVFRISPRGLNFQPRPRASFRNLTPVIAIAEIEAGGGIADVATAGRIADDLRRSISRTVGLSVTSRIANLASAGHDRVPFVVSGAICEAPDGQLEILLELAATTTGAMLWQDRFVAPKSEVIDPAAPIIGPTAAEISLRLIEAEREVARGRPFDAMESHTLLVSAISLMNGLSPLGFQRARMAFETLMETSGRHPTPLSWMAIWFVFRRLQSQTDTFEADYRQARDLVDRALDAAPSDPLALTAKGMVMAHLGGDGAAALDAYDTALERSPGEALALAARACVLACHGKGDAAVRSALRATSLSPLDPQLFLFQASASVAFLSAGDPEAARDLALASQLNNTHYLPALVALTLSSAILGDSDGAARAVALAREEAPQMTVARFVAACPFGDGRVVQGWAKILKDLGLPDG